jgi:hypothetical protein
VCYDIQQPKTLKRELDALVEAAIELKCTNLVVITWDHEEWIEINSFKIKLIPAYQWLLNSDK